MLQPKNIITLVEKASYEIPVFGITDDGPIETGRMELRFCKGNKADASVLRQEGFFTETLLAASLRYLQDNNVGELSSRETSIAITKIEEALLWLGKRAQDRADRGAL